MLDEKTLDDLADIAIQEWLESFESDLYDNLGDVFWERGIPEGDQAENVIEVEHRCKIRIGEMRKVLGGTDD